MVLGDWVIISLQPFVTFESASFSNFFEMTNPEIAISSCTTTRRHILEVSGNLKALVKSIENHGRGKISITADAWSSRICRGYMVVTGHWIDDEWAIHFETLSIKLFPAPHS